MDHKILKSKVIRAIEVTIFIKKFLFLATSARSGGQIDVNNGPIYGNFMHNETLQGINFTFINKCANF